MKALCIALATQRELHGCAAFGLAQQIGHGAGVERRLAEAARLGFQLAIVPEGSRDVTVRVPRLGDLKVVEVATLHDALAALHLVERQGPPPPPPHGLRAL